MLPCGGPTMRARRNGRRRSGLTRDLLHATAKAQASKQASNATPTMRRRGRSQIENALAVQPTGIGTDWDWLVKCGEMAEKGMQRRCGPFS